MYTQTTLITLLGLLGLTSAIPTPASLAPRCGTTAYPTFLQQLTEASPDTVQPNTLSTGGDFHVSQSSTPGQRIYQIAAFENVPAGSYGCTLGITLPPTAPISITGTPTLNVSTVAAGDSAAITYPNNWTWNTVVGGGEVDQGLFGTVTVGSGTSAVVNSESCPVGGGNLAFVFSIASWVQGDASVEFNEYWNGLDGQGLVGVYLTYNC